MCPSYVTEGAHVAGSVETMISGIFAVPGCHIGIIRMLEKPGHRPGFLLYFHLETDENNPVHCLPGKSGGVQIPMKRRSFRTYINPNGILRWSTLCILAALPGCNNPVATDKDVAMAESQAQIEQLDR